MARLLVFRGDLVDREIDLGVTSIRIGRGADNDVVLEDPEKGVSRSHAELRYENGGYVLVDLGSQNGIFQDGARVERARFRPNSAIVVGSFQLMIDDNAGWPAEGGGHGDYSDATIVPSAGRGGYAPAEFDSPGDSRAMGPGTGALPSQAAPGWLRANARPLMFGGGALVLASAIGFGVYATRSGDRLDPEVIAQHIVEAEDLLDQGDPQRAITEHLDPVLEMEPDNADAQALKREAQERIAARNRGGDPAPAPLPPPDPLPSGGTVREPPVRPSPPPSGTDPVDRETTDRLAESQRAIDRADFARASEILGSLPASDARVQEQQRTIRQKRRAEAETHAQQGAESARRSDWLASLDSYDKARKADPLFNVDGQVADVRARMRQDVDKRLKEADFEYRFTTDAASKTALRMYEDVVRFMADHPRLAEVNQRIKELRGK